MDDVTKLFTKEVKGILEHKMRAYPLYAYFISSFISSRRYKLLAREDLPANRASTNWKARIANSLLYIKNALRHTSTPKRADIVFLSRYRPVDDKARQGIKIKTDYLFQNVIDKIHENPSHLNVALVTVGSRKERYSDYRVNNLNMFDFLSPKIIIESLLYSLPLYIRYRKHKGVIKAQLGGVEKIYSEFFSLANLARRHLYDFCLSKVLKNLHPKVIVLNDDVSLNLKPSFDSKLVVVQSALLTEELENWRGQLFSNFASCNTRLSDYFCVSGPQARLVKEKFGKDTKSVIVTGQPRFDKLVKLSDLLDKNEVCKEFGLNPQTKNLLWATQTHSLSDIENEKNISVVYDGLNSLENVKLIIKLHPAEDQSACIYKKDSSLVPVIVKGNNSIWELLYVCDVLITKDSTAAIEAAILGKPVIVLNLTGKPGYIPYVEKGIAIGVYKRQDFLPAIEDALYNGEVRARLAEARKKFVCEYAYIQDGQASKRIADLIIQMVKESRKARGEI